MERKHVQMFENPCPSFIPTNQNSWGCSISNMYFFTFLLSFFPSIHPSFLPSFPFFLFFFFFEIVSHYVALAVFMQAAHGCTKTNLPQPPECWVCTTMSGQVVHTLGRGEFQRLLEDQWEIQLCYFLVTILASHVFCFELKMKGLGFVVCSGLKKRQSRTIPSYHLHHQRTTMEAGLVTELAFFSFCYLHPWPPQRMTGNPVRLESPLILLIRGNQNDKC